MIVVFTGNGKGKTTASLGQAMRAIGRGKRVLMIQFIKGPWRSGEDEFIDKIHNQKEKLKDKLPEAISGLDNFYDFDIKKMGRGFVGILGDKLPKEEHERAALEALSYFETKLTSGKWDMIILDEINVAVSLGLVSIRKVMEALNKVPVEKFVILTGRNASPEFIEAADLVTEMKEIKHPFNDGEKARVAMEF